mmetsp:Transcript_18903/g.42256  ORF Transcript_18903/g.42256 Transcript_18903/m.42256 type:complete len:201 (-) Transcript_18903:122-724(-)
MHLRAPSMSSHEREIGNVDSSSDSMGETPLLPPVSPPALAPAMAIGALWEGIAGALAGGGKAVPLSYRFSTWFSPCASVSHCCSWAICSGASALLSSWTALAALPGPVVQNTSSSRTRSCAASTCCCSSVTNCLCRSRACLADSALRASLELLESPAPGALCDSPKSLPSGPMSIVSIPSSSPTSEAPAEPATSAMARCR